MKAWKLERLGGRLRFADMPVPETRPGSVLIRVEAQALTRYLKAYTTGELKAYRAPEEFTPGGNAIGTVEAVGPDVWHIRRGQRVVISSHLVARENTDEPGQILIGVTSFGGAGDDLQRSWKDGALAEAMLVPAQVVTPLAGLDAVAPERLAAITRCVVPYGGLMRGRLAPGETVVVVGATGAYGVAAVLVALAMGAARVIAAGRSRAKLSEIDRLGYSRVVPVVLCGDVVDDTEALRDAAGGGAHLAFDMVGQAIDPNATLAAIGSLRRGGRIVLMGSSSAPIPIDYMQIMSRNLEIIGNLMHPQNAYMSLLPLVRSGQIDLSAIKPKVFALADLERAMAAAQAAGSLDIVVVTPSHGGAASDDEASLRARSSA